jgi:hypothetical protein
MMLERLGAAAPLDTGHTANGPKALMQRMQAAMDTAVTRPTPDRDTRPTPDPITKPTPGPITKPTPPLTPEELIKGMVLQWWSSEFMQTMLFEDEEKTGMKAEPYA